jgi:Electron transfer DM13
MKPEHMAQDSSMMSPKDMKDRMGRKEQMGMHGTMAMPHGMFAGANDHQAAGSYSISESGGKRLVMLSPDFSISKAPDIYLALSPETKVPAEGAVYLGKLKKLSGAQSFAIPEGTDLAGYKYLVLWCKKYSVTLATAPLGGPDPMMHN